MLTAEVGKSFQHIIKVSFTTCTNPIIHLFSPQEIYIGIVSDFSWDIFLSQNKLQTTVMQTCSGVNRGVLWDCASSEVNKDSREAW